MSKNALARFVRHEFAPPRYLSLPTAGIDISASGVRLAMVEQHMKGRVLVAYDEAAIPLSAMEGGEIVDRTAVVEAVRLLVQKHRVRFANVSISEARGYLFEAVVQGTRPDVWRTAIEQHLDEHVPLPPAEVSFDVIPMRVEGETTHLVGVGYAQRVIEEMLSVFDEVGVQVRAIESETFSISRALLASDTEETVLIVDIGRVTTKLAVVDRGVPRFATTLEVGGHALTVAIQKYFGVTEEEAKKVKAEKGIVSTEASEEYIGAMLSTVSVMREEIARRLEYWQSKKAASEEDHRPVTRVLLVGVNATVRGLPEYFETTLGVPVGLSDVFLHFAERDIWLPPLDYLDSLAYATAIGLALRDHEL